MLLLLVFAAIGIVEGAPSRLFPEVSWRTTFIPIPTNDDTRTIPGWKRAPAPSDASTYAVKSLPDSPSVPPSWAGRMGVPGVAEGNELFFWLFEAEDKSYDNNLIIWLNGGPGCSSMIGAFAENGPLSFVGSTSKLERNPYSWTKLGHVLYIDQPVGTGLSSASNPTPATNNEKVTEVFYSWLKQFYTVFPNLRQKRTHLMGESYGGIYIPYFAERILKYKDEFSINLTSITIGDGAIGNSVAMSDVVGGAYLREKANDLKVPQDIVDAFSQADHICGFDSIQEKAAQYPPQGPFDLPSSLHNATGFRGDGKCNIEPKSPQAVLSSILNSTCYQRCATYATARDYVQAIRKNRCFSTYNINYDCTTANPLDPLTKYLNRPDVQTALNIPSPTQHPFQVCNQTILDTLFAPSIQPIPPTDSILPAILTTHKIPVHLYQGQLDMVINHIAVELVLQNMTWNGAQGLRNRPNIPFGTKVNVGRNGENKGPPTGPAAGVWAYERGLTYHLFKDAGHGVPRDQPQEMWEYVKNVVVGGWDESFSREKWH
ncbi:serine-type carboxypeptidase [Emydomyces testavorans]|uniref:Carboxypeptidase n=1 Tax=Emydomyces testavorans TaxID=2070801 RepID=A0AAF0II30_9EURO|nr:serine-type carboxypeptidase [Emydomyces testavorans]